MTHARKYLPESFLGQAKRWGPQRQETIFAKNGYANPTRPVSRLGTDVEVKPPIIGANGRQVLDGRSPKKLLKYLSLLDIGQRRNIRASLEEHRA
jgi:hypothetical protein